MPEPFPLVIGSNVLGRTLLKLNQMIHVSRGVFSYQMFVRVRPRPSLDYLLRTAEEHSARRAELIEAGDTSR